MENYTCEKKCCNYCVIPYHNVIFSHYDNYEETEQKIKKAGCFIYDLNNRKILLVQSRGQFWGPPKGGVNKNESLVECACREVNEETGMIVKEEQFIGNVIVKNKAMYYLTPFIQGDSMLLPQKHIDNNDANGIGWFSVDCLNDLINKKKIDINQHCRLLIKKIFDTNIVFNNERKPLNSFINFRNKHPVA